MALRRAEVLAFVGFSFTPTDLDVEALFRLALASGKKKTLRRVVIANPNREHRERIRRILAPALRDGALLMQFDDFRSVSSPRRGPRGYLIRTQGVPIRS
jgi:hypothetical protein